MAYGPRLPIRGSKPHLIRGLACLTSALMLSACADTGLLDNGPKLELASENSDAAPAEPQSELQKAAIYWGQEYAKNTSELKPALNYAKNLKALGDKQHAMIILEQAVQIHTKDTELAGEYGRLALEMDKTTVAERYLEFADNATKPDWRIVSARGTVLAKQGRYKDAIPFYERALALKPGQSSLLNNLALANAAAGDAGKAEAILRQAAKTDQSLKIQQNLALVLGLQGKYDESRTAVAAALPADAASANTDYLRRMVQLPAKSSGAVQAVASAAGTAAPTAAAPTAAAGPVLKSTAVETAAAETDAAWRTKVASAKVPAPAKPATTLFKGSAQ